jgi:methionyl-tRNA formyltransferase
MLLVAALEGLVQGTITPIPQDANRATLAPKLTKEDGRIQWDKSAQEVHNQIRGCHPWPGAFFDWQSPQGKPLRLSVFPGRIGQALDQPRTPGEILGVEDNHIAIACRDRSYLNPFIKPAGGKRLDGKSFACGYLKTDCSQG